MPAFVQAVQRGCLESHYRNRVERNNHGLGLAGIITNGILRRYQTLIFLDRQRAHASCERLRRRGSGAAFSRSPSAFALRFLVGAGSAGGWSGIEGECPGMADMSGWCARICVIVGDDEGHFQTVNERKKQRTEP